MNNTKLSRVAVSLCALAACFAAHADETLEAVVVTGTRDADGPTITQPNLRVAKERISRTPGGVHVVDTEAIEKGRVSTQADTFRYAPGVYAQPRFGAEEARLSIRGSGIQRTFHLRGIKLMQDGVPINLADGAADFQSVEPLATRYMTVHRGANALRYGASTLGGAINYVSRTGFDASPLSVRLEAGSFDYRRSHLATGSVWGDADYYASFSTFDQDGFRNHAVQQGRRFNANVGYRLDENVETRFYFSWATSDSELPGNLTRAQLKRDPREAHAGNVAGDHRRDTDAMRFANRTVLRFGASRIEATAYYADFELFHPIFQVLDQDARTVGGELRLVTEAMLAGRRNIFIAGYAPSRGALDEDRHLNINGRRGARTERTTQIATNHEFYIENTHYVLPDLAVVLGVQHTRARRDLDDKFGADGGYDETHTGTSPKYGLLYEFAPKVQFFANLSKSFEPPSFSEGLAGAQPNKAQRGWTYEVGTRGESESVHWDVALYHAKLRDELLGITPGFGANSITVNVPHTVHQGVEAAVGGRIGAFQWQTAALLNRFRFDDDAAFGNNTLPGIPKVLVRGELLYRGATGWYAGPNVEWSPRAYPVDMANSLNADAYAVWGFKLGQDVDGRWSWFIDMRNLFDKRYAATTGVIRDAQHPSADLAQFLPGDGRSIYAGVQWRM